MAYISRSEVAYLRLKEEIQSGLLPPGTRVREVEIAERLGISRTPAREALRRLESKGLVSIIPHSGAVISSLDYKQVMELYDLREVLEGAAAMFAARHASATEIDELNELVLNEPRFAEDFSNLAELNRTFHNLLYQSSHNRFLEHALLDLRDSIALLGATSLQVDGRYETAHAEHEAIVDALKNRDEDSAGTAARLHIHNARRARLELMRKLPRPVDNSNLEPLA